MMPRKWEFIADCLKAMKAPQKVINAAHSIDQTLVALGLGWSTEAWRNSRESKNDVLYYSTKDALYYYVVNSSTCTACQDAEHNCIVCQLGGKDACTPRSKYPDNWYGIVTGWLKEEK